MPIPRITNNYSALYAQDDWRVSSRLTLNLGLRWEYDSDLTGQSAAHAPCPNLTSTPSQPCTWMANVLPLHKDPDTKDFGPRVGFVYDPFGHGRTAIRGGYGIYYDRITLEAGSKELVQNDRALTVTQYAGSSCTNHRIPAPRASVYASRPDRSSPPGALPSPRLSADLIRPGALVLWLSGQTRTIRCSSNSRLACSSNWAQTG